MTLVWLQLDLIWQIFEVETHSTFICQRLSMYMWLYMIDNITKNSKKYKENIRANSNIIYITIIFLQGKYKRHI